MANLRPGTYGYYHGSYYNESESLTSEEKNLNAWYIYRYFTDNGWTVEAISGIIANMEHESALNPGRWQSDNVGKTSGGYSLTQWTPATKYLNWCENSGRTDPSEMDNALDRIIWELDNGEQYYKTPSYPETFGQFTKSTKTPYYLACAFAWNYERSNVVLNGTEEQKEALRKRRGDSANEWYKIFTGNEPPVTPIPTPNKKKKMPIWMYLNYNAL